ncbi:hypothetical protein IFT63_11430 [Stenotrophomonas sp. CFBP 13724]|uniref:hypothetical protein n=1 Tax=Stenotrophomonas sp. CFBP 13724 TaxID=2775298 RepID=UPI00177C3BC0|nr:hypothetical protein [Stenotrophomonas sp. CFBP 13724]MBD8644195.1 hypothetical protein [Stenotrophomonas sp. CFBP 13724]
MTTYEHDSTRVTNPRATVTAEQLDSYLRTAEYDEAALVNTLLLACELHGIQHAARECILSEAILRRHLNGKRPLYLDTLLGVMRALGLQFRVEVI